MNKNTNTNLRIRYDCIRKIIGEKLSEMDCKIPITLSPDGNENLLSDYDEGLSDDYIPESLWKQFDLLCHYISVKLPANATIPLVQHIEVPQALPVKKPIGRSRKDPNAA